MIHTLFISFSSTVRENSGYAREGQAWFDSTAGALNHNCHFFIKGYLSEIDK